MLHQLGAREGTLRNRLYYAMTHELFDLVDAAKTGTSGLAPGLAAAIVATVTPPIGPNTVERIDTMDEDALREKAAAIVDYCVTVLHTGERTVPGPFWDELLPPDSDEK